MTSLAATTGSEGGPADEAPDLDRLLAAFAERVPDVARAAVVSAGAQRSSR